MSLTGSTTVAGRPVSESAVAKVVLVVVRSPRPTVRSVARDAGLAVSTTWAALQVAKERDLVASESGKSGTLRPLVKEVRERAL